MFKRSLLILDTTNATQFSGLLYFSYSSLVVFLSIVDRIPKFTILDTFTLSLTASALSSSFSNCCNNFILLLTSNVSIFPSCFPVLVSAEWSELYCEFSYSDSDECLQCSNPITHEFLLFPALFPLFSCFNFVFSSRLFSSILSFLALFCTNFVSPSTFPNRACTVCCCCMNKW